MRNMNFVRNSQQIHTYAVVIYAMGFSWGVLLIVFKPIRRARRIRTSKIIRTIRAIRIIRTIKIIRTISVIRAIRTITAIKTTGTIWAPNPLTVRALEPL